MTTTKIMFSSFCFSINVAPEDENESTILLNMKTKLQREARIA
jgi:hypothetical protein